MDEDRAQHIAALCRALSDPTRVRLLHYISSSADGTACACHMPEALGISQSTMSFHMSKLHAAGLVTREQRGRWAHWSLNREALACIENYIESLQACSC